MAVCGIAFVALYASAPLLTSQNTPVLRKLVLGIEFQRRPELLRRHQARVLLQQQVSLFDVLVDQP